MLQTARSPVSRDICYACRAMLFLCHYIRALRIMLVKSVASTDTPVPITNKTYNFLVFEEVLQKDWNFLGFNVHDLRFFYVLFYLFSLIFIFF